MCLWRIEEVVVVFFVVLGPWGFRGWCGWFGCEDVEQRGVLW